MSDVMEQWRAGIIRNYYNEVEKGVHDDRCEYRAEEGFYLCNCRKRTRVAAGYTEPPDDLEFYYPDCTRCFQTVSHDGDTYYCANCSCQWDVNGMDAEFTDDHGDDDKLRADSDAHAKAHHQRIKQAAESNVSHLPSHP